MTVTVFGYLILISIDFYGCISPFFPISFSFDREDISTLETMFDHISKHCKVLQKYSAVCHILNSFVCVWKCVSSCCSTLYTLF